MHKARIEVSPQRSGRSHCPCLRFATPCRDHSAIGASVLIGLWRWLVHEGLARDNVPGKTYPIKVDRRVPNYLVPEAVDRS